MKCEQEDQDVEVKTKWFELKLDNIGWKTIIVVVLILVAAVEITRIVVEAQ
jgi:hypothetical protein